MNVLIVATAIGLIWAPFQPVSGGDLAGQTFTKVEDWRIDVGVWGPGSLQNDDAADFLDGALRNPQGSARLAIESVERIPDGELIEFPEAGAAIAASELLAALNGRPMEEPPEGIDQMLSNMRDDPELRRRASDAVHRILKRSEFSDPADWGTPDDAQAWRSEMMDLIERLK